MKEVLTEYAEAMMVYDMINRTEYSRVLNENKMLREELSRLMKELKNKREDNDGTRADERDGDYRKREAS